MEFVLLKDKTYKEKLFIKLDKQLIFLFFIIKPAAYHGLILLKDHEIMSTKTKPLIITAIVVVAIVAFIVWQNKKDNTGASVRDNNLS